MGDGLIVDGDVRRFEFGKTRNKPIRFFHHEVDIEGDTRGALHCLGNRHPIAYIRHKVAVHHIKVDEVCPLHPGEFLSQAGKIR